MFAELDATLKTLLERSLPGSLADRIHITFATPDVDFPPLHVALPALSLFLYHVEENQELRNRTPEDRRVAGGHVIRVPAPVRVDCHYLVSAWAKPGESQAELEHALLGHALRVLLRHREIPPEMLVGTLKAQAFPVTAAAIQPNLREPRSDFWQALGRKPRAAFDYRVTISVDVAEPEDIGLVAWASKVEAGG